ncbi:homeobox protein 2-like [Musca domestica]|uniref:Homeobox protein 2-like n=1 Tax=Musca domestica TaxID=7370 RepID=A0ABM3VLY8_MUSDO|nr:homeobox protein 2-like [Musca domestica]
METNDLKTIVALVPVFTGKKEDLESFTANLELDSRVQNRIKQKGIPKNINDLISALKTAYKPVKSSNAVLNELSGLTQRNNNLQGFANKIESLVSELNEIQISDLGEQCRDAIIATNNLTAFNTFLNGLQDQQIVSTIEASRVSTFADALRIAERYVSRTKQRDVMYHNAQAIRDNKHGKKKYYNNGNNNNKRYNYNNGNNNDNNGYNRNKGNNKNYNSRDYNVNQVQDQGNFQVPETLRPSSPENTQ